MTRAYFIFSILFSGLILGCASLPQDSDNHHKKSSEYSSKNTSEKIGVPSINNAMPDGAVSVIESFEDGNFWQIELKEDNFALETWSTQDWSSHGDNSCNMGFSKIPEGRFARFFTEAIVDAVWESARYIVADMNNTTNSPLSVCFEVWGDAEYEYFCTVPVLLGAGENTNVIFDLNHEVFFMDGTPAIGIREIDTIKRIAVKVLGKHSGGSVVVDKICLVR